MKHLVSVLLFIFIAIESFAAAQMQNIHNVVKNVVGTAFIKDKNAKFIAIKNGAALKPGDIVYTGPGSSFEIHFEDESVMTVTSLTVMKVDELLANQNPGQSEPSYQSKFKLRVGEVKASVSRKKGVLKKFEVQTPVATAAVRGTEKIVNYAPDAGMKVNTLQGQVLVMVNNGIERYVNQGEFTKSIGMETKLPQAELQKEQAKAFITDKSEQYILENKGLKVTQEANQVTLSHITKAQKMDPEEIIAAQQGVQQDKRNEESLQRLFEEHIVELKKELSKDLPPVTLGEMMEYSANAMSAYYKTSFTRQRVESFFNYLFYELISKADTNIRPKDVVAASGVTWVNDLYPALKAAGMPVGDLGDTEEQARDNLLFGILKIKLFEKAQEHFKDSLVLKLQEQVEGKEEASQQARQIINVNKLSAGL